MINKHEFAKAAVNKNFKNFVMHVAVFNASKPTIPIHPLWISQVIKNNFALVVVLQQDKVPIEISSKYVDCTDVFSLNLAIELLNNISINKHAIELVEGK